MSPEERDELIEFILQSQSNAATRHQEMMAEMDKHDTQLKEHTKEIQTLAGVSRDLVETARLHSRRLDRLDNSNS